MDLASLPWQPYFRNLLFFKPLKFLPPILYFEYHWENIQCLKILLRLTTGMVSLVQRLQHYLLWTKQLELGRQNLRIWWTRFLWIFAKWFLSLSLFTFSIKVFGSAFDKDTGVRPLQEEDTFGNIAALVQFTMAISTKSNNNDNHNADL